VSFYCSRLHRHLLSFPTRRSSDLAFGFRLSRRQLFSRREDGSRSHVSEEFDRHARYRDTSRLEQNPPGSPGATWSRNFSLHSHRSEEHTSELQSRRELVCRLLLEK